MKTKSLYRMRQTCSFVYDLVEKKEDDFSSESGFYIDFSFTVGIIEEFEPKLLIGSFYFDDDQKDIVQTTATKTMFDDLPVRQLSISVSTLISAENYFRMMRRLRRMKPGCSYLTIQGIPSANLYKFLDNMECSGDIDITGYFYCDKPEHYILRLNQQIQEQDDLGTIRRMKCSIKEELPPNLFGNKRKPAFKNYTTLFDCSTIANYNTNHVCTATHTAKMAARKIRKMQISTKFCLLVESRFVYYQEIYILLIDNTQEALLKALKEELRFDKMDDALEKEFPTANDKRKAEILKQTVAAYSKAVNH